MNDISNISISWAPVWAPQKIAKKREALNFLHMEMEVHMWRLELCWVSLEEGDSYDYKTKLLVSILRCNITFKFRIIHAARSVHEIQSFNLYLYSDRYQEKLIIDK